MTRLRKSGNQYFGDVSDLTQDLLVGHVSNRNEEVYKCPYCVTVRGKPDNDGKFYFNSVKLIGQCKKCDTIIISTALRTLEQIRAVLETEDDQLERYDNQHELS